MALKIFKNIKNFLLKHCCFLMTIFTVLMLLFEPNLRSVNLFGNILILLINALIFTLGPYVLSGKRRLLFFSLFGGLLLIVLSIVKELNIHQNFIISIVSQSIFLTMCFVLTITAVYYSLDKKRPWSGDRIFGLIYGYLLIGFFMSEIYFFLGRYGIAIYSLNNLPMEITRANCLYFSYIVQTTMGFGDILPGNEFVRRVVIIHACVGVLYTAVLIGRVINYYGVENSKK